MKLISCYFPPPKVGQFPDPFSRMATVLAHSAALNSPGLELCIKRISPALLLPGRGDAIAANTRKLEHWEEAVRRSLDGELLVLMDADTFVLGDLAPVFDHEFDFAYTVRDSLPPASLPFNAGVIFLRVSDRTRAFMRAWLDENLKMATDSAYHGPWFRKYGGINQAALGKLLEDSLGGDKSFDGLRLRTLPCSTWNCEDATWARFDPKVTRVVHVKSALRRDVFNLSPAVPQLRHLTRLWRELERDAMRAGRERP